MAATRGPMGRDNLRYAALDKPLVTELLHADTDPDVRDRADRTPLHFAAQDNTVAVARLLLEYGADVNARNDHDNTPLREPIRRAGRAGVPPMIRVPKDARCGPRLRNEHGENIPRRARRERRDRRLLAELCAHVMPGEHG